MNHRKTFLPHGRSSIAASQAIVALLTASLWIAGFAMGQDRKAAAAGTDVAVAVEAPAAVEAPVAAEAPVAQPPAKEAPTKEPPSIEPPVKEPPQEPAEDCTVCHKQRNTLVLPCNGLAFQRHVSHGDTFGACPPTMGSREE